MKTVLFISRIFVIIIKVLQNKNKELKKENKILRREIMMWTCIECYHKFDQEEMDTEERVCLDCLDKEELKKELYYDKPAKNKS